MQFRLSTLLLAMLVVAMSLAVTTTWWIVLGMIAVAALAAFHSIPKALALGFVGLIVVVLANYQPMWSAGNSTCLNNLHVLGLGLLAYQDRWGTLPPPCTYGPDGQPQHSWREMILKEMDRADLADELQLEKPRDAPANQLVLQCRLCCHICPCDRGQSIGSTSYVAVLGPNSVWGRNTQSPGVREPGETPMLIEWPFSGIHWSEPRDLRREDLLALLQTPVVPSDQHVWSQFNVCFADGSVSFLSRDNPEELVRALFGEDITEQERLALEDYAAKRQRYARWLDLKAKYAPIAWVISVVVFTLHVRLGRRPLPPSPA